MGAAPVYQSTPTIGVAAVSTANTARDGTGTLATITSAAPTAGRVIRRIIAKGTGDPADSVITLFLHDGSAFWLFDEIDLGNPAAASNTVEGWRAERRYDDLVLPSGWSIRAGITVALTSGVVNVFALGAELT
jgi:hypothetical protein